MSNHVVVVVAWVLLVSPVYAVCGDCNEDGAVTVDEILTTVNYALNGTGQQPSPTLSTSTPSIPIGSSTCSTSQPGHRFQACGEEWVVVEVKLSTPGSPQSWALRYPVHAFQVEGRQVTDAIGGEAYSPARYSPPQIVELLDCSSSSCFDDSDTSLSICGFQASISPRIHSFWNYGERYEYSLEPSFEASYIPQVTVSSSITANLKLVLGDTGNVRKHIYLQLSCSTGSTQADVPPISNFNFSFIQADYESLHSPDDLNAAGQEIAEMLRHVSISPL